MRARYFAFCLLVLASASCGDDDEVTPRPGGAGKGGASGAGGKGGAGGSVGTAGKGGGGGSVGTAGKGGAGGSVGSVGSAGAVGSAGTAGDAGVPDATDGAAGDASGGAAGDASAGAAGDAGVDASDGAAGSPGDGAPPPSFPKRFGDSAFQEGRGVVVDASGNVYTIGYFQGIVDFGGGPVTSAGANDVYVAKFDAAANLLWAKQFGDSGNQLGLGIALDTANNVLITGYFTGTINFGGTDLVETTAQQDVWVAKLDTNGNHVWSQAFGTAAETQQGWSVENDLSNNVYVAGIYRGTINFGGGNLTTAPDWHAFVVKFNSGGAHQWSRGFGNATAGQTFSRALAVDGSGNVYISGQFDAPVSFGGATLTPLGRDAYLAKFDTTGSPAWSQRYGDGADSQGRRVGVDGAGSVYLNGYFTGTVDFGCGGVTSAGGYDTFLAKFSTAGVCTFSNRYGGATSDQFGEAIAFDSSNRIILGGEFEGTTSFGGATLTSGGGRDAFVAKLESTTAHVWSRSFGDGAVQRVWAVAVEPTASGRVYATGAFAGTADLGSGPVTSAGDMDAFLLRYDP